MPISARKMDRTLVSVLGFERRMGRHQIYILRIGGKQVARTLISKVASSRGQPKMPGGRADMQRSGQRGDPSTGLRTGDGRAT